jgi:hypothetical protein
VVSKQRPRPQRAQQADESQTALDAPAHPDSNAVVPQSSDLSTMDASLQKLQQAAKRHSIAKGDEQHARAETLSKWYGEGGAKQLGHVASECPPVAYAIPSLRSLSGGRYQRLVWTGAMASTIPRIISMLNAPEFASFRMALGKDFHKKHNVFYHAREEPIPRPRKDYKLKPSCLDAGVCMCGAVGDAVWRVSTRMLSFIKHHTSSPQAKSLLVGGDLVIQVVGNHVVAGNAEVPPDPHFNEFLHISLMCLSPFRPTFRVMDAGESDVELGVLLLRSTDCFLTSMQALSQFVNIALDADVSFCLYVLHDTSRPIVSIDPTVVEVKQFSTIVGLGQAASISNNVVGAGDLALDAFANASAPDVLDDGLECFDDVDTQPMACGLCDFSDALGGGDVDDHHHPSDVCDDEGAALRDGDDVYDLPEAGVQDDPANKPPDSSSSDSSSSSTSSDSNPPEKGDADVLQDVGVDVVVPAVVAEGVLAAPHTSALNVIDTPHGTLRLYKNLDVVAHCQNPLHNLLSSKCKATRSSKAGKHKGRPIGFLYAWLLASEHEEFPVKHDHVRECKPSHAERVTARDLFYDLPGGKQFSDEVEKELADGDQEEPEY